MARSRSPTPPYLVLCGMFFLVDVSCTVSSQDSQDLYLKMRIPNNMILKIFCLFVGIDVAALVLHGFLDTAVMLG